MDENDDTTPSWDSLLTPRKPVRDAPLMKLVPRKESYRFRLACTPISFRRHKWAFRNLRLYPISPADEHSERELDVAWDKGGFVPVRCYAAFVFDREDGCLKILEDGCKVFGPINNFARHTRTNPASPTTGWDWVVLVTMVPLQGREGMAKQVIVSPDTVKKATPFTSEEFWVLSQPQFERTDLETRHFVKSSPEQIKSLWERVAPSAHQHP